MSKKNTLLYYGLFLAFGIIVAILVIRLSQQSLLETQKSSSQQNSTVAEESSNETLFDGDLPTVTGDNFQQLEAPIAPTPSESEFFVDSPVQIVSGPVVEVRSDSLIIENDITTQRLSVVGAYDQVNIGDYLTADCPKIQDNVCSGENIEIRGADEVD